MTALVALLLASAPACPNAIAHAAALSPAELARSADEIALALDAEGAGPSGALVRAARALEEANTPAAEEAAAAAFREKLSHHCALAAAPAGPLASPADRAALGAVLARPELARTRTDLWALRRALDRLWDFIVDLLGTNEAERYASVGRALFVGAAAAAGVLAISALRRRGAREPRPAPAAGEGGPTRRALAPDDSAERAEEALRRGDGRGAVRFSLLAALSALERAGRVPRGRALTNGELVAAASQAPDRAPPHVPSPSLIGDLAALAATFDRTIYGGAAVEPEEARGAVERARRVLLALGSAR